MGGFEGKGGPKKNEVGTERSYGGKVTLQTVAHQKKWDGSPRKLRFQSKSKQKEVIGKKACSASFRKEKRGRSLYLSGMKESTKLAVSWREGEHLSSMSERGGLNLSGPAPGRKQQHVDPSSIMLKEKKEERSNDTGV